MSNHSLELESVNSVSQQLLNSFEQLPESEKQQVAAEILRWTLKSEQPSLSDEELILSAEAVFLSLDAEEAEDEQYSESW